MSRKKKKRPGQRAAKILKSLPKEKLLQKKTLGHRSKLSLAARIVLAAISVASGVAGIWLVSAALPPKVEINAPTNFFEPSDAFSGEFAIRNQGTFSIYKVHIECVFKRMNYRAQPETYVADNIIEFPLRDDEIEAGKHSEFVCPFRELLNIPFQLRNSTLIIKASYRPSILFWLHSEKVTFFAAANKEGEWYWFSN